MIIPVKHYDKAAVKELLRRRNALPTRTGRGIRRLRRPPRYIPPRSQERQYWRELNKIIAYLKEITKTQVIDKLPHILQLAGNSRPTVDSAREIRNDDFASEAAKLIEDMRKLFYGRYSDKVLQSIAEDIAVAVASQNKSQIMRIFEVSLGVNPFGAEPWLAEEIKNFSFGNVGLIKNVTDQYMNNVSNSVFDGARQGLRAEEIEKQIVDHDESVAESRAKLIARDQVNKFNGDMMKLRQVDAGVSRYTWRTSNDDRVRDTHEANADEVFFWDDPPAETGHPGEDIQCRCYAEPVLDDLIEGADDNG